MNKQSATPVDGTDLITITKQEYKAIFSQRGHLAGLYGDRKGFEKDGYAIKVGSMAHEYYLDFIAGGILENRDHLTQAVQDFKFWQVLKDAEKYGVIRLPKSRENIDKIINSPFVEVLEYRTYMTPNIGFSSVDGLEEFINNFYFLKLTDMGAVALSMHKKQEEQLMRAMRSHREEMQGLKQHIASRLLSAIGLDDIIVGEDDSEGC